ncbi:unnamed protein product, partial [Staurois parvus]
MLGLRRAVCEILGRAGRSHSDLLSAGRQVVRSQPWIGLRGSPAAAGANLIQIARTHATSSNGGFDSQLDDLPPTLLKEKYDEVQKVEVVNDVVKRLLSLDMASKSDKLKIKIQQLVDKVKISPDDKTSKAVQKSKASRSTSKCTQK